MMCTFAYEGYRDRLFKSFRSLKALNECVLTPNTTLPEATRQNLEILIYVMSGTLEYKDHFGAYSTLPAGMWLYVGSGSGTTHSLRNPSPGMPCQYLKAWIKPLKRDYEPTYQQKWFGTPRLGRWITISALDARDDCFPVRQDASVHLVLLDGDQKLGYSFTRNRFGWLHITRGSITVNSEKLGPGDALAIEDQSSINLYAHEPSEAILFDLS